ncbi:hypothetical protein GWO43_00500 [candidate division KSB1 bacterium]|nr:hypothetical protein [candidate division KSB1 bacterium]NIV69289.1 hypothetical protein [Phycisphaerae bacterium]NIR68555.1 hypothetical protein [candidate division KSB1 bacterium]NIS22561.1 hypothetical protein [candidate division KSB1 bacterium]NIT69404.1 hypothetical protein [candidate division KSB1 bacterium]
MISKKPINPNRIRRITGSFSWLDHRLLHDGFLSAMSPQEMLLYFFLVLVGDKNGVSFYSYDKICALLKLELDSFIQARDRLVARSLIACEAGRYQVLALPEKPVTIEHPPAVKEPVRFNGPTPLAEIFKQLAKT